MAPAQQLEPVPRHLALPREVHALVGEDVTFLQFKLSLSAQVTA